MPAPLRLACTLLAFAWSWNPILAADDEVAEQWSALQTEYADAMQAWGTAYGARGIGDDEQIIARYRDWPGFTFAPRLVTFGESHPAHEAGFAALGDVVRMARSVGADDRELEPHFNKALELILQHHRGRDLTSLQFFEASPGYEKFWRTLSVEGASRELRTRAAFMVAHTLKTKSEAIRRFAQSADSPTGLAHEYFQSRRTGSWDRYVGSATAEEAASNAIEVFESVIADYPDVASVSRPDKTLADLAQDYLFEIKHLSVGRTAPDIAGNDLAGEPIKLSDFRGKVVLIVFWASWCGPCMEAVQHEKELAERFADQPFSVVGVNLDRTQEFANEAVEKHAIPWRSFWDGGEEFGPIATAWVTHALPSFYLIDHTGVIRFRDLPNAALDGSIELLLNEVENG